VGFFVVGDASGTTAVQAGAAMTGWLAADLDGLTMCVKVGAAYNKFMSLRLTRAVPTGLSSRTILAAPLGGSNEAGQNKLYVVSGTDFSMFQPDQKIWVVNQQVTSGVNAELVEILSTDVPTRTIFLKSNLVNSYDYGALVGQCPQPMLLWGSLTGVLETSDPIGMHGPDGYAERVMSYQRAGVPIEADDYGNLMPGPLYFYQVAALTRQFLGISDKMLQSALGTLADEDTLFYGGKDYVVFLEPGSAFAMRVV